MLTLEKQLRLMGFKRGYKSTYEQFKVCISALRLSTSGKHSEHQSSLEWMSWQTLPPRSKLSCSEKLLDKISSNWQSTSLSILNIQERELRKKNHKVKLLEKVNGSNYGFSPIFILLIVDYSRKIRLFVNFYHIIWNIWKKMQFWKLKYHGVCKGTNAGGPFIFLSTDWWYAQERFY